MLESIETSPINIGCGSMDDMPCILNYCVTGIVERFLTEYDIKHIDYDNSNINVCSWRKSFCKLFQMLNTRLEYKGLTDFSRIKE